MAKKQQFSTHKTHRNRATINYFFILIVMLMAISGVSFVSASLSSGLISYYDFEDGTGTTVSNIADKTNLNGSFFGSPTWDANSILGTYSIHIPAENNYVEMLDDDIWDFTTTNAFSVSIWVYADAFNVNPTIFHNKQVGSATGFYFGNFGGTYTFSVNTNAGTKTASKTDVTTGRWQHLVTTYNSTNVALYVNGTLVGMSAGYTSTNIVVGNRNLTLGNGIDNNGDPNGNWDGELDEVGVWSRALSPDEVIELYNDGSGLTYSSLLIPSITLNSPVNDYIASSESINLTASFNISGTNDYTWRNATFYNYKSGAIYNQSFVSLTNENNTIGNTTISGLTLGNYEWNAYGCYANATFSNCTWASNNNTYDVGALILGEYYQNNTISSASEYFETNISLFTGSTISRADLIYNGTAHTGTYTSLGSMNYKLAINVSVPYTATNTDYDFYWKIYYNSGGTITQNLTTHTQSVTSLQSINITSLSCSAGFSSAFNFTSLIEANLSAINFNSISYDFLYGLYGNSSSLVASGTFTNIPYFNICINSSSNYYVGYGEIQYQVTGYSARRFYIFENERLTNITISNNIYSLESADSTAFQITAVDTGLNPYENHYITLLRWYPDLNSYKIVDMGKTDNQGQTVVNVKTNEVDYRLGLYTPQGVLVKLLDPVRMVCQTTPCVYSLIVDLDETDLTGFLNIQSNLSWNPTTKIFTYVWNDPSQDTTKMNLTIWKYYGDRDSEIVCSTSSSSFTGILICDITGETGEFRATVYRSASPPILKAFLTASIRNSFVGLEGGKTISLFIGLILVMAMALMGVVSPPLVIILSVIALIPLIVLGAISFALFITIGAIAGIILHFLRRISG